MAFGQDSDRNFAQGSAGALAARVWWFALAALLVPSLSAWLLRGAGYVMHCEPTAAACIQGPMSGMLGLGLKGMIDLSWIVGANIIVTFALAGIAGICAIVAGHPLRAALTILLAPLLALLLPIVLVDSSLPPGCVLDAEHGGPCALWGAVMGPTFHQAATAPELMMSYLPLAVSGGLVAGLLGWLVVWGYTQMHRGR